MSLEAVALARVQLHRPMPCLLVLFHLHPRCRLSELIRFGPVVQPSHKMTRWKVGIGRRVLVCEVPYFDLGVVDVLAGTTFPVLDMIIRGLALDSAAQPATLR